MRVLNDEEVKNVTGGTGVEVSSYPSKKFKCLSTGCIGPVIGNSFDGVHYEGTCQICGQLWDYNVNEAIM